MGGVVKLTQPYLSVRYLSVIRLELHVFSLVIGKKPTLLAFWTTEPLLLVIGEIGAVFDNGFREVVLLLVTSVFFVRFGEARLTDPLGKAPGQATRTTPIDITTDHRCYAISNLLARFTPAKVVFSRTTHDYDISRSAR